DDNLPLAQHQPRRLNRQLPLRFRNQLPEPPLPLPPVESRERDQPSPSSTPTCAPPLIASFQLFTTQRNKFGLYQLYRAESLPTHDPDDPSDVECSSEAPIHSSSEHAQSNADNPFHPYPNANSLRLGDWYWCQGSRKSQKSFKQLLDIIASPDFHPDDVRGTNWKGINRMLGSNSFDGDADATNMDWPTEEGWRHDPIAITVPFHSHCQQVGPKEYTLPDFHHHSLTSVIRETLSDPTQDRIFHYEPYELRWQSPHKERDVHVYRELFTSEAFIGAHQRLQESPPELGCDLPRVVAGMMFWSDTTQLSSFGGAKLWPLYLYFGNHSKYQQCRPSSNLCTHVAYFQTLPDDFKDFAMKFSGKAPSDAFFAHCHRELFQEQWRVLLEDEFIEAYQHGIVITCCDRIKRRFYPRIFTYSADYPEKILIVCIRNLGTCLCPQCLIPKDRVQDLSTDRDHQTHTRTDNAQLHEKILNACRLIYDKNYSVDTTQVEALLKPESFVPTLSAFSDRLHNTGFDLFVMLVVDLLHEFELGVWKAILIHLLRILDCSKKNMVHELDRRFRQVPSFGRNTIRRFSRNTSEMKKMAARDFEDVLQCAIPVFEDLVPDPHNTRILQLLYLLAEWHGFAKLHMHTDDTLKILDSLTIHLGSALRTFKAETCPEFATKELKREMESRKRREARDGALKGCPANSNAGQATAARRPKTLNLKTYKLHALGDYALQIRRFGTTDSFSTQTLARIEHRQAHIRRIMAKQTASNTLRESVASTPEQHHHIGQLQNYPDDLMRLVRRTSDNPAVKDFILKLKAHLLPRIKALHHSLDPTGTPSLPADYPAQMYDVSTLSQVLFKNDRIYHHNLIRINYTTYDVRRAQDVVNPRTDHCDTMLLSNSESHPFCYARVLNIYHANVIYTGPGSLDYRPRCLEFLWVRWFELVTPTGEFALDRLHFVPMKDEDTFGFVDPSDVLRSCHLIPAFAAGKQHCDGVGISRTAQDSGDWKSYYVNRFVDRDMLLRYHWGMGIGHAYSHVPDAPDRPGEQQESRVYSDTSPAPSDTTPAASPGDGDDGSDHDQAELTLADREMVGWDESESNDGSISDESLMDSDRELALYEMYDDLGSDAEWLEYGE
ncbi:hypothetical protein HYDPIDRAFT_98197, partial [Hydnomerulius pinastri MD-312]